MTVNIQDAINCVNVDIEETTCENCRLFGLDYSMCAEVDKIKLEALEKQIPKKPKKLEYEPLIKAGWEFECPKCGSAVGENRYDIDLTQEDDYCPTCGQKLDWGE